MTVRIIAADDHDSVLVGIRATLESSGAGQLVGTADGTDALLHLLSSTPCDLLITDLTMPDGMQTDGYTLIELIRRRYPDLRIIVLSMTRNLGIIGRVQEAGVAGVIDKASSLSELPLCIGAVMAGRTYVSSRLQQRLLEAAAGGNGKIDAALSTRETEVLRLLGSGLGVSDVARQLQRSVGTVSRQKASAMKRLGLSNDRELYNYLEQSHLSDGV